MTDPLTFDRRRLLIAGGALSVSFVIPDLASAADAATGPCTPDKLDSFIAVQHDGSVLAFFGKVDPGQGVDVAIGQIVADELDVAYARVRVIMGDTSCTVNQGGAAGSTGVAKGGITLRYAAAEARRLLVERAAAQLKCTPDAVKVADGVCHFAAEPSRRVSYGDLVKNLELDCALTWNGKVGTDSVSKGLAKPKPTSAYKVVGSHIPRADIRDNVFARQTYVTEVRPPGLLHARVIRPPTVGATPSSVDETSIAAVPGARVVRLNGSSGVVLAVVADKEWNAIRAARALKIAWSDPSPGFPAMDALYEHMRQAPTVAHDEIGDPTAARAALSDGARVVSADYEWPFQSHASMGPACAVADVKADFVTVWSSTQKPHYCRDGVAKFLNRPPEKVRVIWMRGPGSYGRNDAGDAAMDAALLSRELGRPVRVQYMRDQATGWDPKGPASVHACAAALDAGGRVVGYRYLARGFSGTDTESNESNPRDSLSGQLMGIEPEPRQTFAVPAETYAFPNATMRWETVPPLVKKGSPLRTTHLRDPIGPQTNFASESFVDELALAAGQDPLAFRLAYLDSDRGRAVLKAAGEKFGWAPRVAGSARHDGEVVTGRGMAYAQRGDTVVAVMTEVEVDRLTGTVRPKRWVVAHDCGLVINPGNLRLTIEGNIVQATSRSVLEEVRFDPTRVTSVDWLTYPILEIAQAPDLIEVVIINRPDMPSGGAGEASSRPVPAAIANAIFDATGARLRRAPFTPERVKAALT